MSGKDARRLHRREEAKARKAAVRAARAQGCTCKVEVVFDQPDHPAADSAWAAFPAVSLRHDEWCPLLRVMEEREPGLARTQVLLITEKEQR